MLHWLIWMAISFVSYLKYFLCIKQTIALIDVTLRIVKQTCQPAVEFALGLPGLFHPGENAFARTKLVIHCLLAAHKRSTQWEVLLLLLLLLLVRLSLLLAALHDTHTARPFDLVTRLRQPKCHMAALQRAWKKAESGRRPNDPSYQLNSALTWIACTQACSRLTQAELKVSVAP